MTFLSLDEVLRIHADQIQRYGGSSDIRDRGLLESALAMPSATFAGLYLHSDLAAMAAAYLYPFIQNHPFVDGNKRVGAVAALVFLALNGVYLTAGESELEDLIWRVAQGTADKTTIAAYLRLNTFASRKPVYNPVIAPDPEAEAP